MNILLIALLLQFAAVTPRSALENPGASADVPSNLKRDYDRAWARFLSGKEDARTIKDIEKLLKIKKDFEPGLIVLAYIDLSAGKTVEAGRKLEQVLQLNPRHRIALSYLSDLAFAHNDYARAADLYARLLVVDSTRTDVESRRQKAELLATEQLLRAASSAAEGNQFSEAEGLYQQALKIAPDEPILYTELGALQVRQKKWEEALAHFRRAFELRPTSENRRNVADTLISLGRPEEARTVLDAAADSAGTVADLEHIGRWGEDVEYLRSIEETPSITREHLAVIIVRYFPQIGEFQPGGSRIVTDIQDSNAVTEIQMVIGLGLLDVYPNHTFRPALRINRGDLAVSLARIARLLGPPSPDTTVVSASDLAPGNALYADIRLALGLRFLTVDNSGRFSVDAAVSGEEALEASRRLLEWLHKNAA
jgi:tetratricopeptide (TPR) repeat protein